jgi:predicted NAD-dependent protein-ADP-ribosyltransferase YbiA (DUF1768 family)
MDYCSYFIEDKALFGSSPNQTKVQELEELGVRYFIDLTYYNEKLIDAYQTEFQKIRFPIRDRSVPDNPIQFCSFILHVESILKNLKQGEKIYLHCKGGHGRSGLVVASILCFCEKKSVDDALSLTREAHAKRKTMREKWRIIGSPQTETQKEFVRMIFDPIMYHPHQFTCFSSLAAINVNVIGLGSFPTAESAYQAFKNPWDENYIKQLQNPEVDPMQIGENIELRKDRDWSKIKVFVMYAVLKLRFDQNPEHKNVLMHTYLRPIIRFSRKKTFWCDMKQNVYGRLLEKLRLTYITQDAPFF